MSYAEATAWKWGHEGEAMHAAHTCACYVAVKLSRQPRYKGWTVLQYVEQHISVMAPRHSESWLVMNPLVSFWKTWPEDKREEFYELVKYHQTLLGLAQ